MRKIGMMFLLAGMPWIAGSAARAENANLGGTPVEKRNFTEAEIQSTLKALGVTQASPSFSISCDVENSQGIEITTVTAASYPASSVYWLRYEPAVTLTKQVRFMVTPLFTGSPLGTQVQVFNPNSAAAVLTPFGIPAWGKNLTAGPWMLVVQNDAGQSANYRFTVQ